jgi:hypothetical protein
MSIIFIVGIVLVLIVAYFFWPSPEEGVIVSEPPYTVTETSKPYQGVESGVNGQAPDSEDPELTSRDVYTIAGFDDLLTGLGL